MRIALCAWLGGGTRDDPFRPDVPDGVAFGCIDLRDDQTSPLGWALVVCPDLDDPLPPSGTSIDLGLDGPASLIGSDVLPLLGLDPDLPYSLEEAVRVLLEPVLPDGGHDIWCGGVLIASWR